MADKEYFNDQGDPVTFIFKHGRRIPITIKHVLSNDIRGKMNRAGITDTKLEFEYNRALFSRQLKTAKENNPHGWMVDQKSPEELKNCKMLLSEDGTTGVAIKPDGDIVAVFKHSNSQHKNAVTDLIISARENGGVKMDCYGKVLTKKYQKCGFEPVARVEFNKEYAPDDFPKDPSYKSPDYLYVLKKTNKSTHEVIKDIRQNSYKLLSDDELAKLPTMEYDEAMSYRDSLIKGGK